MPPDATAPHEVILKFDQRILFDAVLRGDFYGLRDFFQRTDAAHLLDRQDSSGRTPLYVAALEGRTDCLLELLERGANVNIGSEDSENNCVSALNAALYRNQRKCALVLLENGADPSITTNKGQTALHRAMLMLEPAAEGDALRDTEDIVHLCLAAEADIDQPDSSGSTPLMLAARYGPPALLDLLLARGANITCTDMDGDQAIHNTWFASNLPKLHALVGAGASVKAKNFSGASALWFARDAESIDALIDMGANINQVDYKGRNLLLSRLINRSPGDLPVHLHLLDRGLDPFQPDHLGATVWQQITDRLAAQPSSEYAQAMHAAISASRAKATMQSAISQTTQPSP